jgi:ribonuclease HII
MELDLWTIERELAASGYSAICGVDEAGRGPLAGPVCAAAVILPLDAQLPGLNDSKKLSDARRRALFPLIQEQAIAYGIAFADETEIDSVNILQATFLAMRRAVEQLKCQPDFVLVDGNRDPVLGLPTQTVIGGDGKSASIAAASILAKVTRDDWMEKLDETYPQYGFAVHKGYGTKRHYAALQEYGPCPAHRRSFLKKFYERAETDRTLG